MVTNTTIKVPMPLRDRINRDAGERGMSAARLLEELLDHYERQRRFDAVRRAYANLPAEDDYWNETQTWNAMETEWPHD